jgi:hypothetical protein
VGVLVWLTQSAAGHARVLERADHFFLRSTGKVGLLQFRRFLRDQLQTESASRFRVAINR